MKRFFLTLIGCYAVLLMSQSAWAMANYAAQLLAIQQTWAEIKYSMPKAERRDAFASLVHKTESFQQMYPKQADAMLWSAIVLYHYAGEVGGIKALGMVKKSYHMLQQADKKHPKSSASDGLIHTVLGQLYYKVPGWPIAFGDDAKAQKYLRQGLAHNPESLDANYFMGDYLLRNKQYQRAAIHLRRAIQAPARAQRPIADAGRKAEALKLLRQIEDKT